MFDVWQKRRVVRGKGVGLTLIDLMVVVCVIGVVAAMAIPLHANAQARACIEKAQEDLQMLAAAVRMYAAHMGAFPAALTVLTATATNGLNQSAVRSCPSSQDAFGWDAGLGRVHLHVEHRRHVLCHRGRRRYDHHRAVRIRPSTQ